MRLSELVITLNGANEEFSCTSLLNERSQSVLTAQGFRTWAPLQLLQPRLQLQVEFQIKTQDKLKNIKCHLKQLTLTNGEIL